MLGISLATLRKYASCLNPYAHLSASTFWADPLINHTRRLHRALYGKDLRCASAQIVLVRKSDVQSLFSAFQAKIRARWSLPQPCTADAHFIRTMGEISSLRPCFFSRLSTGSLVIVELTYERAQHLRRARCV